MSSFERTPATLGRGATLLLLVCALAFTGCTSDGQGDYRVAVIKFQQETCTFCPGGDAPTEDWLRLGPLLVADQVLTDGGGYIDGFVAQAADYPDVELLGLTSPDNLFGGSSRSWSTQESFDTFVGGMVEELITALPVDGVYLALHGALAVRGVPRPEAEIARRFREIVGPDVPIAGTFDLHGNEDEQFLEHADFAFVTKRFPHYDDAIQGARAARALHRAMSGTYTSTTATRKPGIITPTVLQWTGAAPASDIMERARRWEAREQDVFVSVFYGFPWSDVPDVGATVHVMTNNDQALADEIADDMNEYMWRVRESFANGGFPRPNAAAPMVVEAIANGQTPVAIGDYSDRPGDATHITRAFDAAGVSRVLYGAISSPATLDALQAAGASVGDAFDYEIGGYTASGGDAYRIEGTIVYVGPWAGYEYTAVVSYGDGNTVFIAPAYTQIMYPEDFAVGGIDPADYDVFVVKSRAHFRRGFDETGFAKTIIIVEATGPFMGTTFLDALPYENVDLSMLYPYGTPVAR